jgi:DNA-binding response OmpR family regulator
MAKKILYAEDEPASRELVSGELRRSGYTVDTAEDGEEAIRLLDAGEYDLLLLDIRMPRKTGIDVLSHLKEKGMRPRIIMLTGVGEVSIAITSVRLGANEYLTKPFRLEDLFQAIDRLLA